VNFFALVMCCLSRNDVTFTRSIFAAGLLTESTKVKVIVRAVLVAWCLSVIRLRLYELNN